MNSLTIEALAHRYLYYVHGRPVISDRDYDALERKALNTDPDSPLRLPGSDRRQDYPQVVIDRALELAK